MSGLEQEFPDATTPESKAICEGLGFANHGLVIRSADGQTIWSQPDHQVRVEDARAKLKELFSAGA